MPIAFLYLASYVFEFCEYHRIFLHYVAIDTILTTIDYRNKIGFDTGLLLKGLGLVCKGILLC